MAAAPAELERRYEIVGRSSSTFTRLLRIFAGELGVSYSFRIVRDLTSANAADYADNPALKLPALIEPDGTWFGALNACRALAARANSPLTVIWPEAMTTPLLGNAQELVSQAMSTEIALIMGKLGGVEASTAYVRKLRVSLESSLSWLEANLADVLKSLPLERSLSHFEVALFCLVDHLEFREVLRLEPYPRLVEFRERFAARPSARSTLYRFDS